MSLSKVQGELLRRGTQFFMSHGWDLRRDEFRAMSQKPCGETMIIQHFGSWKEYVERCRFYAETGTVPIVDEEEQELTPSQEYLVDTNARLQDKIKRLSNINLVLTESILASLVKCSFKASPIPTRERGTSIQEFHAMRSDDHIGEKVESASVQGIAEYNVDIFRERNDRWLDKVITFREQDKHSLGLNKLVLYMLGDHLTGELVYGGQAYQIDLSLADQVVFAVREFVNTILTLAGHFPLIEIFCVIGNHPRMGKKGEGHPRSNCDYLLFRWMQESLRKQPNVKVFVSESPTMIVQNGHSNFALNHNDNVNMYQGIPYYGLERKARRLSDLYGIPIHYKLGGHFHTPANLNDETIMNGTIVGGSDLSVNRMNVATRPSQKIFYFDPEHGIHRESNLYLADPIKLTPDEHGIYTAHSM